MIRVSGLHVYPLKAARAIPVAQATVEPWGLRGDRRWMVVEAAGGRFVSQREQPRLALVTARHRNGHLEVTAEGRPMLRAAEPVAAPTVAVTVWRSSLPAASVSAEADAWFSDYLGVPVRLVYLADPTVRPVDPDFGRAEDRVSFADGFPLLLASTASLDAVNDWLAETGDEPLPMDRFRPNLVIDGAPAWAEDGWTRLRVGPVGFRSVKPCARCVVTTVNQDTAVKGRQPLAVLARHRRVGSNLLFGQNLIPDGIGAVRVGDPVEILA